VEAIDPAGPISDYYSKHPWREDGGYLRSLVQVCQAGCRALPSYPEIRELALSEARRAQVLGLNHYTDPAEREHALKRWVAKEYPDAHGTSWWELSAAASAPLTIHALLALAAEPGPSQSEIRRVYAAYFPSVSAATTMLDSYVDQHQDNDRGDHSYIEHYPSQEHAAHAIRILISTSLAQTRILPHGHRHAVVAASMIAMYLSKDSARTHALRTGASTFIDAGGSLTRLLLPILRAWRIAYSQRGA
jgi:tetraprenyl-beta-curcumene synthase